MLWRQPEVDGHNHHAAGRQRLVHGRVVETVARAPGAAVDVEQRGKRSAALRPVNAGEPGGLAVAAIFDVLRGHRVVRGGIVARKLFGPSNARLHHALLSSTRMLPPAASRQLCAPDAPLAGYSRLPGTANPCFPGAARGPVDGVRGGPLGQTQGPGASFWSRFQV